MGSMSPVDKPVKKRSLVVEWLNCLFPGLNIPLEASEEELRMQLFDGTILCGIVSWQDPSSMRNQRGAYMSSEQRQEKIRRFLSAIGGMGLPRFNEADLEHGSISAVVDCLLFLRDHLKYKPSEGNVEWIANRGNQPRKKWMTLEDDRDAINASQGNFMQSEKSSLGTEKKKNFSESRLQRDLQSPIMPVQSAASVSHAELKFQEVFQLKQGRFADIPTSKISEIMKSNGLDNSPTQSLLSVIYGILDESIERKNGEIPFRVASLLRRVVQEIERRISSQAEHIRNQNNFIKAREEKYQSRIRVLETLASGTNEETHTALNQVQVIKEQKIKAEESKKQEEQHALKLMEEKKTSDRMLVELKQELETTKNTCEYRCQQLEVEAKQNEARLQKRIKEVELLLSESSDWINELDVLSSSKFQNLNHKENALYNLISFQLQSVKDLRTSSESIKIEVINSQKKWKEEIISMGIGLKALVDAAENYHTVLAENRKLYNEVQELKGNIRVCCRVRPFLPGQNAKSSTLDYIGDNGELVLVNPSRQGKDGHRMFKFNKIFGPNATQAQVFMDIQPLIRSVLDGYNVCIFAYGQTGSGKTYTMSGPNSASQEEWGVNYRALNDLFHISQVRRDAFTYEVSVQMVEIYNEQVRDLLSNSGSQKRLGICSSQPNGLAVPDASMIPVKSTSDVLDLIQFGQKNRAVSSTALNERSSRSHSILTIHVRGVDLKTGSTSRGCLHLIDLAGSERVERSEVTGDRLKEAQHINKSLSALGDVIFALSQKSAHVPYRNSKLTQVLHSSLGGQAKTLMFVQVNPDVESYSESLSTLKFAERVSGVELGAAKSNKEGKDVKDLIEQVASLKNTIARKDEDIEQLQTLKDLRARSPKINSFRRSSSFSGVTQQGGGKVLKQTEKVVPDSESNYRDLDAGTLPSMLEDGGNAGESCHADDETGGCDDVELDGRLSDASSGDLSVGEEAEYSMGDVIEGEILPEAGKLTQVGTDKIPKTPSRLRKPLSQRTGQALSNQAKISDSLKVQLMKKTTSSQVASSSAKQLKR